MESIEIQDKIKKSTLILILIMAVQFIVIVGLFVFSDSSDEVISQTISEPIPKNTYNAPRDINQNYDIDDRYYYDKNYYLAWAAIGIITLFGFIRLLKQFQKNRNSNSWENDNYG